MENTDLQQAWKDVESGRNKNTGHLNRTKKTEEERHDLAENLDKLTEKRDKLAETGNRKKLAEVIAQIQAVESELEICILLLKNSPTATDHEAIPLKKYQSLVGKKAVSELPDLLETYETQAEILGAILFKMQATIAIARCHAQEKPGIQGTFDGDFSRIAKVPKLAKNWDIQRVWPHFTTYQTSPENYHYYYVNQPVPDVTSPGWIKAHIDTDLPSTKE